MEARQTLGGSSISKSFVAAVLVSIAIGLGVMGAYIAKDLGGSSAAATQTQPVHVAPATNLRQDSDYPVLATPAAQRSLPVRHE